MAGGSSSSGGAALIVNAGGLTEEEHNLYDRQIRLWGHEAQNKLRNASVLLVGLTGLGAEIAKNIVLAGLKTLTLIDSKPATDEDAISNFLLSPHEPGISRAAASLEKIRRLNPMVELRIAEENVGEQDASFFKGFDVVILLDQDYKTAEGVNALCREQNIRFVAGGIFGWSGFAFFDFDKHNFLVNDKVPQVVDEETAGIDTKVHDLEEDEPHFVKKPFHYASLKEAFNVNWHAGRLLRKAKRILPSSYFPIRAFLHGQERELLNGDEEHDRPILETLWKEELEAGNANAENQSITTDHFDYFFGPQFVPVCAIVGGVIGQEVIKTISENKEPLVNTFFYSALDRTGRVCHLPPP